MLTNKKRKKSNSDIESGKDNSSSGSDKFIISSQKDSYDLIKIKGREALLDEIKKLKNPFTILDNEIISKFNEEYKNLKKEIFLKKK